MAMSEESEGREKKAALCGWMKDGGEKNAASSHTVIGEGAVDVRRVDGLKNR
jgi:hypothetical protein